MCQRRLCFRSDGNGVDQTVLVHGSKGRRNIAAHPESRLLVCPSALLAQKVPQVAELCLLQYHHGPDADFFVHEIDLLNLPGDGHELDDVLVPAQLLVAQGHGLEAYLAECIFLDGRAP